MVKIEDNTLRISAIVCTHNRAVSLSCALSSLALQTLPTWSYEVIVVDNASADGTAELIHEYSKRHSNLRYVHEDRLGLSVARNTGAAVAEAPYVAYMDDDARAEPEWLERLLKAFESATPSPAVVGGRVLLDWGGQAPDWLPAGYFALYSHVDHGESPRYLTEGEHLVGANLAFHKKTLLDLGGFNSRLGRRGRQLLSGEEALVLGRIRGEGLPIYYAPRACVWHRIDQRRQRRGWLVRRVFWDGASAAMLDQLGSEFGKVTARRALMDFRCAFGSGARGLLALAKHNKEQSTESLLSTARRLGRVWAQMLLALGAYPETTGETQGSRT